MANENRGQRWPLSFGSVYHRARAEYNAGRQRAAGTPKARSRRDGEAAGRHGAHGAVVLDATEAHGNPMGTVQGGILAAVADAAMGWAFMTTLGENESYTTLEVKVNFLRPVWAGRLE